MRVLGLGLAIGVVLGACGSDDPADVAGTYTVNVTNRDNGCGLANWTVGESSSGIGVMITQEGTTVSASVGGFTGAALDFALGSHVFAGDIDGDTLELDLFGSRSQMNASCVFTYNAKIVGEVAGDAISGRVEYRAATTTPENPDCAQIQGCLTFQEFNGTRPPT